jgi:hypothetical protein
MRKTIKLSNGEHIHPEEVSPEMPGIKSPDPLDRLFHRPILGLREKHKE